MMRDGDMGSVPVVDDGRLIGIVTDRDIVVRCVAEGSGADTPVSEAMTTEIFTVKPDDFVFEAVRLMGDKQVRRIPVVADDGKLAGIIRWPTSHSKRKTNSRSPKRWKRYQAAAAFWTKK